MLQAGGAAGILASATPMASQTACMQCSHQPVIPGGSQHIAFLQLLKPASTTRSMTAAFDEDLRCIWQQHASRLTRKSLSIPVHLPTEGMEDLGGRGGAHHKHVGLPLSIAPAELHHQPFPRFLHHSRLLSQHRHWQAVGSILRYWKYIYCAISVLHSSILTTAL